MGLIRLLFSALLLYIGYRVIKSLFAPKGPAPATSTLKAGEETVQDPICKVFLTKDDAIVGNLDGERHYFCSMNCLEKFREQLDHKNQS